MYSNNTILESAYHKHFLLAQGHLGDEKQADIAGPTQTASTLSTSPEVEFMNVFSQYRVDSRSLRSTLSYKSTLMEFTDNLSKPPDFFFIQTD
jgi:hypothetical protein